MFDLMTTHSASTNCIVGYSRYVLFQVRHLEGGKALMCAYYIVLFLSDFPPSPPIDVVPQTFFDLSASYALLPARGASALPLKFPQEFRDALPQEHHYLLDWVSPAVWRFTHTPPCTPPCALRRIYTVCILQGEVST